MEQDVPSNRIITRSMARAARKKRKKRAAAVQHFLKLSTQVFEADVSDDGVDSILVDVVGHLAWILEGLRA